MTKPQHTIPNLERMNNDLRDELNSTRDSLRRANIEIQRLAGDVELLRGVRAGELVRLYGSCFLHVTDSSLTVIDPTKVNIVFLEQPHD